MFDLVTSASSIHGAYWLEGAGGIFAENQAMEWLVKLTGMPEGAFGVFTSGGTEANLSALVTAREAWRTQYPDKATIRGLIITSDGAHSSIRSMAKVIDADILAVPTEERFEGTQLRAAIDELSTADRSRLFAIIAAGGTTNAGIVDDLEGLADVAEEHKLWFHIDAAYGGGALAAPSVRHLFNGIERADSVTIDPHKWLFSTYDCGAVIYRRPEVARAAHAQQGSYLDAFGDDAYAGFNPCEYQIQLTRRLRGLPFWFSLAMHGTERYTTAVERGLSLAKQAADQIDALQHVELVRPPSLSCVLFRRVGWSPKDYAEWSYNNHKAGFALVTPTKFGRGGVEKETVARFCFINPDTTEEDIAAILAAME